MKDVIPSNRARQNNKTPLENCQDALQALAEGIQTEPRNAGKPTDLAEQATVRLRDSLITRLRQEQNPERINRSRATLEQVNTALSLIIYVEYPELGADQEKLSEARDILQTVLNRQLSAGE